MGEVLQEIGMVPPEKVQNVLDEYANHAHDRLTPYGVAGALEEFDVAVSVHADDIDDLEQDYTSLLEDAAALTHGAVTVSNVRLHEGEEIGGSRDDILEFERNGRLVAISAEHFGDRYEYFDQDAAINAIDELSPDDDPRAFHLVDFEREPNHGYDSIMVLATPEQAKALEENLGLTLM
ncbi:hypothetical protein AB0C96_39710 [Streptomyces sp. NPDC048506]|uniref:hypothetical protein n=1 Tax=Streptomyces sp. NPDC048506 TaxID=3155028 RepID=UPI00341445C6